MALALRHALGREEKVFVTPEATYGTFVEPSAADAVKCLSTSMVFGQERVDRMDKHATTRSLLERISRRQTLTYSIEKYLIPSGVAGTAPDDQVLLAAAMGREAVTGSDVTYTMRNYQQGFDLTGPTNYPSFQLTREVSMQMMQVFQGCYVGEFTGAFTGADEVKLGFSGGAKSEIHTFAADNATTAAGSPTVTLDAASTDDYMLFTVGSMVQILDTDWTVLDNNSNTGFKVISISSGANTITLDDNVTLLHSNKIVAPFTPTETTAGSPAPAIVGTCKLDTVEVPTPNVTFAVVNNAKELNDEFGETGPTDHLFLNRGVGGTVSLRMREDLAIYYAKSKLFTAQNLQVVAGATAAGGNRVTFDFGDGITKLEMEPPEIPVPEQEEAMPDYAWVSIGSAGEDEMKVTFD